MRRQPRTRRTRRSSRGASNRDDRPDGGRHLALGRRGEELAAAHLRGLGFRILARDLRTRTGEIDILARRRGLLVAVEVKTRCGHAAPEWTVAPAQLARIRHTLSKLAPLQRRRPRELRVDVVAVRFPDADTMEVRHLPGRGFPPPTWS